jgi:hypothetical protein
MNNTIKGIYNSPFKKCIITSSYYPMLFMIRFVEIRNMMIPDSLYTSVIIYNIVRSRLLCILYERDV